MFRVILWPKPRPLHPHPCPVPTPPAWASSPRGHADLTGRSSALARASLRPAFFPREGPSALHRPGPFQRLADQSRHGLQVVVGLGIPGRGGVPRVFTQTACPRDRGSRARSGRADDDPATAPGPGPGFLRPARGRRPERYPRAGPWREPRDRRARIRPAPLRRDGPSPIPRPDRSPLDVHPVTFAGARRAPTQAPGPGTTPAPHRRVEHPAEGIR